MKIIVHEKVARAVKQCPVVTGCSVDFIFNDGDYSTDYKGLIIDFISRGQFETIIHLHDSKDLRIIARVDKAMKVLRTEVHTPTECVRYLDSSTTRHGMWVTRRATRTAVDLYTSDVTEERETTVKSLVTFVAGDEITFTSNAGGTSLYKVLAVGKDGTLFVENEKGSRAINPSDKCLVATIVGAKVIEG